MLFNRIVDISNIKQAMEFIKLNAYIEHFDSLVRQECTGPANEFAQKLNVSERTLHNYLRELRSLGIDVIYDYGKRTYKYSQRGRIFFGFTTDELRKINGGATFPNDLSLVVQATHYQLNHL